LSDNPNPNYTGVGNRRQVTETPRPGPVGTRLEPAASGPELVGRVVDPLGRAESAASVRVLDLSRGGQVAAEVATDGDGRFEVRNLQPGTRYELVAIRTLGGQRLAGSTVAVPPDTNVLIQVAADYASSISPHGHRLDAGTPVRPAAWPAAAAVGQVRVSTPALLGYPQSAAATQAAPAPVGGSPPSVPTPGAGVEPDRAHQTPSFPKNGSAGSGASAPVPTAKTLAFVGTGLENVPVLTLDGQTRRLGELDGNWIVLDFFGSWCGPCRRTVPLLNELHRRYASQGVQIVGVACEYGNASQAIAGAERARRELAIEYGVVADPIEAPSKLRDYFRVQAYPTLVLLDRKGAVLFQHVGGDAAGLAQLDAVIRQVLARR
jgi:thiol-disulfide isomerase/thioredoxin